MDACKVCGSSRCIGKYLLHPKELGFILRTKETHLKINPKRDFRLVDSPSSGEVFTRFKELHIIAAPDEDVEKAREEEVLVYVEDLKEKIRRE